MIYWMLLLFGASADVHTAVELLEKALTGKVQTSKIPDPFNRRFGESRGYIPAAMVNVSSADDTKKALDICLANKAPVALRSSVGHSYIGQSTVNNGIVINFDNLREFTVIKEDDGSYSARLGAGLELLEVYSRLARHDPPLGIAAGDCRSVGIAGLTLGGGLGVSSAKYGVTVDRLKSAEVVIYNKPCGRFEVVEATGYNEHSDLFFAIRGGMGGNYGAVVSLTFSTFPADKVLVMKTGALKPKDVTQTDLMRKFMAYMHSGSAGPELFGSGQFSNGAIEFQAQCFCDRGCVHCNKLLDGLQKAVEIVHPWRAEQDYGEAMWMWMGCSEYYPPGGLRGCTERQLLDSMEKCWRLGNKYKGQIYQSKSVFFPKNIPLEILRFMETATTDEACHPGPCTIQLYFHGHAALSQPRDCNEAGGSCTAFDHRSAGWWSQMLINWSENEPDVSSKLRWLKSLYQNVFPRSSKTAYQNLIDIDLADGRKWVAQYFPNAATYPRLQKVKCRYNAINMFTFPAIDKMVVEISDGICRA
ncbi:hypothetical protein FOL47_007499 [Perkinsus chesapeaki]|uniref:FAD-binding PCMH-type domain-containing protein n=1 Tax=Perkinsus chesapeaki TaxID=330153 RepID=A0A7J6LK44_PERCH|nr:hypothetical protein FOL47_007499 [Perkinsus chesapeaki]